MFVLLIKLWKCFCFPMKTQMIVLLKMYFSNITSVTAYLKDHDQNLLQDHSLEACCFFISPHGDAKLKK
jgi:hypothetical protein